MFFSPLFLPFPFHPSERKGARDKERERERGGECNAFEREKKREGELGGGDWFRGINPLMLDVHAPAGTTSCTLDTCTRGISII